METVKPKRTPEEIRAYQRAYYRANREKLLAQAAERYKADPEARYAYHKKWKEEHKEQHNAVRKAYREANRERLNAQALAAAHRRFAENPEAERARRRATKAKIKAKDPQTWNAKQLKWNRASQMKMVAELTDGYVRQRLARENDDSPRKVSAKDIPQSLVEAKRLQLLILRSLKNEEHNRTNNSAN